MVGTKGIPIVIVVPRILKPKGAPAKALDRSRVKGDISDPSGLSLARPSKVGSRLPAGRAARDNRRPNGAVIGEGIAEVRSPTSPAEYRDAQVSVQVGEINGIGGT